MTTHQLKIKKLKDNNMFNWIHTLYTEKPKKAEVGVTLKN